MPRVNINGVIVALPDGLSNEQMTSEILEIERAMANQQQLVNHSAETTQQSPLRRGMDAGMGMDLGLNPAGEMVARGLAQGIGDVGDLLNIAARPAYNALLHNTPLGNVLPEAGPLREGIPEVLGMRQPETNTDRQWAALAEGAASYLPFLGAGKLATVGRTANQLLRAVPPSRLGQFARNTLPELGQAFTTRPVLQGASAGVGGLLSSEAEQAGGGPWAQFGANVGADIALTGGAAMGRTLGRGAKAAGTLFSDLFTNTGAQRVAGRGLRSFSTSPNSLEATLSNNIPNMNILAGSEPTLSQVSGDYGLAGLERALSQSANSPIGSRYIDQANARQDALSRIFGNAEQRVNNLQANADSSVLGLRSGTPADKLGDIILGERLRLDNAFRTNIIDPAYAKVDPLNSTQYDPAELLEAIEGLQFKLFGEYPARAPDSSTARVLAAIGQAQEDAVTVPFSQMQKWRSALGSAAADDMQAGRRMEGMLAGQSKNILDDAIQSGLSTQNMSDFDQANQLYRQYSNLYRNGANEALARNNINPSTVPGHYFHAGRNSIEDARTFVQGMGTSPEAIDAMRDYIMQSAYQAANNNGKLSSRSLRTWIGQHADALNEFPGMREEIDRVLFDVLKAEDATDMLRQTLRTGSAGGATTYKIGNGQIDQGTRVADMLRSGVFDQSDVDVLSAVNRDTMRANQVSRSVRTPGSDTARNLSLAHALDSLFPRTAGSNELVASGARTLFNRPLKWLGGFGAQERVMDNLTRAALEPDYALALLRLSQPKSLKPSNWNALGSRLTQDLLLNVPGLMGQ